MRIQGQCGVTATSSSTERGIPLPATTHSGRDIWSDFQNLETRRSPIQLAPLTPEQLEALNTTQQQAAGYRPDHRSKHLDTQAIVAMYATGATIAACARHFGVVGHSIKNHLVRSGVQIRHHQGPPKRPRVPLAPVDAQTIIDAYTAGETAQAIAARLHHSGHTVRRYLTNAGVPLRDDRGRNGHTQHARLTPEDTARIIDLYAGGLTKVAIAQLLGRGETTIGRTLTQAGVTTRNNHKTVAA